MPQHPKQHTHAHTYTRSEPEERSSPEMCTKNYIHCIHTMTEIIRTEKRRSFYLGALYLLYCIFQIQQQSSEQNLHYIRTDIGLLFLYAANLACNVNTAQTIQSILCRVVSWKTILHYRVVEAKYVAHASDYCQVCYSLFKLIALARVWYTVLFSIDQCK